MKRTILTNQEFENKTGFISDGFSESVDMSKNTIFKRISENEIECIIVDNIIDIFSLMSIKVSANILESSVYTRNLSEEEIALMSKQLAQNHKIDI